MKRLAIGITLLVLIAVLILSRQGAVNDPDHSKRDFRDAQAEINGATLELEIVDTKEGRLRGLSDLPRMESEEGMLFVFDAPHVPRFWMKDMHFPIDILWLGEDHKVVDITKRALPGSYRSPSDAERFSPSSPVHYALEVVAGFADVNNIKIGDKLIITKEGL